VTRARSPNLTGSIRRRPSGLYEARVTVGTDENGRQLRKSVYGRTNAEVRAKMITLQGQVQKGASIPRGRIPTLADYAERWLGQLERRPSTVRRYGELLKFHINPAIGRLQLTKIERSDVVAMMRRVQKAGRKNATANRTRELLRNILNEAIRDELVSRNVAALVPPFPTSDATPGKPLPPEDVASFFRLADKRLDGPLWLFLLGTGCRVGEALALTWELVDFESAVVRFEKELRRERIDGEWRYVIQDPKTADLRPDKAKRTVGVPKFVINALERQREEQTALRQRAKVWDVTFGNLVFSTRTGRPANNSELDRRFDVALKAAGLRDIRLHDLRHSTSSLAASMGIDPKLTAVVLGHANPSMTLDRYTHNSLALSRLVAEALDRATGQGASPATGPS
jgi:integrase